MELKRDNIHPDWQGGEDVEQAGPTRRYGG